jgi:hypothetical protein
MPVIEQKIDPVLLGLDGIISWARAKDNHICDPNFDPAGGSLVGTDFAIDLDGSLQGKRLKSRPACVADYFLNDNALQGATSVT